MHIPDGFLTNRVALSLGTVSAAAVLYAARRVRLDAYGRLVPLMGVMGAFTLAAQMLNFPVLGGTSGHLVGGALLAILLGPMAALLTMTTVVLAQALFLQDGGLLALGANIFSLAVVASFSGYATFRALGGEGKRPAAAAFAAGWVSLMASAAACALVLAVSGVVPLRIGLTAMAGYHAIIGLVEGGLTAGMIVFLARVRPDLLAGSQTGRFRIADWVFAALFAALPFAILALAGSSELPDPLQGLLEGRAPSGGTGAQGAELASAGRFADYATRAAVFVALIAATYLVSRLAHKRRRGA